MGGDRDVLGGIPLAGALATRGDPAEQALKRLGGGVLLIDCGAVDSEFAASGVEQTGDVIQRIAAAVEQACNEDELLYRVGVGQLLVIVPSAKTFGMVLQRAEALRSLVEVAAGDTLRTVIVGALARRGMLPYAIVLQRLWETLERARAAGRRSLIYREHATLTPVQVASNARPPGCAQAVVMPILSPGSGLVVAWWVTAEQPTWLELSEAMFASLAPLITATPSPVPVILDVDPESLECPEQATLLVSRVRATLAAVDVQIAWTFRGQAIEPGMARANVIEALQQGNMPVLLRAQVIDPRVLASLAALPGAGVVLDTAEWASVAPSDLCVPLIALAGVRGALAVAVGARTKEGATLLGRAGVAGVAGEWVAPPVRPDRAASVVAMLNAAAPAPPEKSTRVETPKVLPVLPGVLSRLHRISDDGGDELLTLASSDPPTALRLLAMASADLEPGVPMLTLAEALVRVGTANFRMAYLENSVGEVFLPDHWAGARLWLHPVQTALWAGAITRMLAIEEFGEAQAYLVGLLHDVGRLAFYQRDARALARADDDGLRPLADVTLAEHRVFHADHATLGAEVCRRWGIQERFEQVVRLHHVLTPVTVEDPVVMRLLRVVQVADLLSEQMMIGRNDQFARESAINEVLRRVAGAPRLPLANTVRLWDLVAAEAQRRMLKVGLEHLA